MFQAAELLHVSVAQFPVQHVQVVDDVAVSCSLGDRADALLHQPPQQHLHE